MPHLLLERIRYWDCGGSSCCRRGGAPIQELTLDFLDLIAGSIFVVGSVCFFPDGDLDVFLLGCHLFVVGSAVYVGIGLYSLMEAYHHDKGVSSIEFWENVLYAAGSWLYLIGTILYWPEKAHYQKIERMKDLSFGQYFNVFTPELEGSMLFIVGSFMFVFASFANALNHRKYEQDLSDLLVAITAIDMFGAVLYAVGSIAFIPDLGCNQTMAAIGVVAFVIGSLSFVIAAIIGIHRTLKLWRRRTSSQLLQEDAKLPIG